VNKNANFKQSRDHKKGSLSCDSDKSLNCKIHVTWFWAGNFWASNTI